MGEIEAELSTLQQNAVDPDDIAEKLAEFDGVWEVLQQAERVQVVQSLIQIATCSGAGEIRTVFCP